MTDLRRVVSSGAGAALAGVAVLAVACGDGGRSDGTNGDPLAGGDAVTGRELFDANCAACHGIGATGTTTGPPLVHRVYEPSHHGDVAFLLAVQRGVQPHHWDFGPMPPLPELDVADVAHIIAYVRALQREAGIE